MRIALNLDYLRAGCAIQKSRDELAGGDLVAAWDAYALAQRFAGMGLVSRDPADLASELWPQIDAWSKGAAGLFGDLRDETHRRTR